MKKYVSILCILLSISIILNILYFANEYNIVKTKDGFYKDYYSAYEHMLEVDVSADGYIKDSNMAVKIAKAYFGIKFGFYTVDYDEENQVWVVDCSSFSLFPKGGYIIIQKSDGKIISADNKKR